MNIKYDLNGLPVIIRKVIIVIISGSIVWFFLEFMGKTDLTIYTYAELMAVIFLMFVFSSIGLSWLLNEFYMGIMDFIRRHKNG